MFENKEFKKAKKNHFTTDEKRKKFFAIQSYYKQKEKQSLPILRKGKDKK